MSGLGLFCGGCAGLPGGAALLTLKYLRILSRRLGPMPLMASKSSTLLNTPYALRICKIFSAVAGPIPGTNCSCSDVAVFKFTGAAGGFFFATKLLASTQGSASSRRTEARSRAIMGG